MYMYNIVHRSRFVLKFLLIDEDTHSGTFFKFQNMKDFKHNFEIGCSSSFSAIRVFVPYSCFQNYIVVLFFFFQKVSVRFKNIKKGFIEN